MQLRRTRRRKTLPTDMNETRECLAACLITDAERYTTLTEAMPPGAVVDLVNRYFAALFAPVLDNGGEISDVKGDGLLALWNAESAGAAFKNRVCRACLEIVEQVDGLNRRQPAHRLPTRLGVDFGPIAIARVGARERFEYRPVGDPVNTASRLEELNKLLQTKILVSDSFAQDVSGFVFRDVGSFRLRGKQSPTRVRELVGEAGRCDESTLQRCHEFGEAVAQYRAGNGHDAQRRFRSLCLSDPADGAARYYLRQLEAGASTPGIAARESLAVAGSPVAI